MTTMKLSASSPSAVLISEEHLADPYPKALLKSHLTSYYSEQAYFSSKIGKILFYVYSLVNENY